MKLYVGNLPFSTTDDSLKELFSAHGQVTSARVVMDRMSGRSRGFGFVEFADSGEGQAAIAALNGKEFGGRTLVVNEARPDGARGGGGGGRGAGGGRGGFGGGDRGGYGGGDRGGFGGGFGGDWPPPGGGRGFGNERRDRGNRGRGSHGGGRGRGSGGRDDY